VQRRAKPATVLCLAVGVLREVVSHRYMLLLMETSPSPPETRFILSQPCSGRRMGEGQTARREDLPPEKATGRQVHETVFATAAQKAGITREPARAAR